MYSEKMGCFWFKTKRYPENRKKEKKTFVNVAQIRNRTGNFYLIKTGWYCNFQANLKFSEHGFGEIRENGPKVYFSIAHR